MATVNNTDTAFRVWALHGRTLLDGSSTDVYDIPDGATMRMAWSGRTEGVRAEGDFYTQVLSGTSCVIKSTTQEADQAFVQGPGGQFKYLVWLAQSVQYTPTTVTNGFRNDLLFLGVKDAETAGTVGYAQIDILDGTPNSNTVPTVADIPAARGYSGVLPLYNLRVTPSTVEFSDLRVVSRITDRLDPDVMADATALSHLDTREVIHHNIPSGLGGDSWTIIPDTSVVAPGVSTMDDLFDSEYIRGDRMQIISFGIVSPVFTSPNDREGWFTMTAPAANVRSARFALPYGIRGSTSTTVSQLWVEFRIDYGSKQIRYRGGNAINSIPSRIVVVPLYRPNA